jgi:D-glycero-D-manno-heptose 1,7-bisphosphate phosphatase
MVGNLKAAFLDRDGVINKAITINNKPYPPSNADEVEILDGVIEAIRLLRVSGRVPVVITNQPDVARGHTTIAAVEKINLRIKEITEIDKFYVCYHDDEANCECRKPKTGLILNAKKELRIELKDSFLVGDRRKDIQAGQECGLRSYFIDNNYSESPPNPPFERVGSLLEAVQLELGIQRNE